jgi:hypothetical protein
MSCEEKPVSCHRGGGGQTSPAVKLPAAKTDLITAALLLLLSCLSTTNEPTQGKPKSWQSNTKRQDAQALDLIKYEPQSVGAMRALIRGRQMQSGVSWCRCPINAEHLLKGA